MGLRKWLMNLSEVQSGPEPSAELEREWGQAQPSWDQRGVRGDASGGDWQGGVPSGNWYGE